MALSSQINLVREDGRSPTSLREIKLELGLLSRMDGSAKFGFGSTQVLASFHGPQEVRMNLELVDKATLEVVHRPIDGISATTSKILSASLSSIFFPILHLHSHPRSLLQLSLQSLSPNLSSSPSISHPIPFSARATSINASTLAILDAGSVGMRGVVVAVAVAEVNAKGKRIRYGYEEEVEEGVDEWVLVLDPTKEEEADARSRFVAGWAFGAGLGKKVAGEGQDNEDEENVKMEEVETEAESECVYLECEGEFDEVVFQKAYNATKAGCKLILEQIRGELMRREVRRGERAGI